MPSEPITDKLAAAWRRLVERMPEPLRREPKKTATLAALAVVVGGLGARQLVFLGNAGPADASANGLGGGATANAATADGPRAVGGSPALRARADKLEQWLQPRFDGPGRNLFAMRLDQFVPVVREGAEAQAAQAASPAQPERFWDRLAKSIASQADLRRQRQLRTEIVLAAASRVKLQSTVIQNGVPRAMIDGRLFKVGETIVVEGVAGGGRTQFRLDRIGGRSAVLERDGLKLEVSMGSSRVRVIRDER